MITRAPRAWEEPLPSAGRCQPAPGNADGIGQPADRHEKDARHLDIRPGLGGYSPREDARLGHARRPGRPDAGVFKAGAPPTAGSRWKSNPHTTEDRGRGPMMRPWRRWRISWPVAGILAAALALSVGVSAMAQGAKPIKIGFGMALTGGLAGQRQGRVAGHADLERRREQEGRAAGPPGRVRLLRRPDEPVHRAGDLHQAARRRQGRPRRVGLRHEPDRARHAARHRTQAHLHGAVRARQQREVQVPALLPDRPERPERRRPPSPTASSSWQPSRTRSPRRSPSWAPTPSSRRTRWPAPGSTVKKHGFQVVYDKTYPPNTVDYTPIVRAIKATNPDIVFVGSYPPDSAGMILAAQEVGLEPKMFGGGMVGLHFTALLTKLGPKLNGIVDYGFWRPGADDEVPGRRGLPAEVPARGRESRRRPARLLPAAVGLRDDAGPGRRHRGHEGPRSAASSPTTSTPRSSTRSSARSSSAPTASGPRHGP